MKMKYYIRSRASQWENKELKYYIRFSASHLENKVLASSLLSKRSREGLLGEDPGG